jgi:hypothetical protein
MTTEESGWLSRYKDRAARYKIEEVGIDFADRRKRFVSSPRRPGRLLSVPPHVVSNRTGASFPGDEAAGARNLPLNPQLVPG